MSTTVAAPAHRGRLVVEKKVIERVAGQVAAESSDDAGGFSGGLLGLGAQSDLTARPEASVELVDGSATVALDVAVAYPSSIVTATDRIRDQIVAEVARLTGVEVTRVDITVTALHRAASPTRRVQ